MKRLALAALALLWTPAALADGDVEAGRDKARVCTGCHGRDGISLTPIYPNLAGQKAPYLVSALQAYRDRDRSGGNAAIMYAPASRLSDQDMADIAAYYASLEGPS